MGKTALDSSWTVDDIEQRYRKKFGDALVDRALKRTIEQVNKDEFTVHGDGKLGDSYQTYTVNLTNDGYICTCVPNRDYHKLCSHVMATMLFRKGKMPEPTVQAPALEPELPFNSQSEESRESSSHQSSASSDIPDITTFTHPTLPSKFQHIFPHQWNAVTEIMSAFDRGEKIVMVDAPVGSGKTLIAELVRQCLNVPAIYVCSTKSLQEQFLADFPYAKLLQGRSNYPTADFPEQFNSKFARITAADCTKKRQMLPACRNCDGVNSYEPVMHCNLCHPTESCPYEMAKYDALTADYVAVLNTSYFMAETSHVGMFSSAVPDDNRIHEEPHFGLVIIDEADLLEEELFSQVEVAIPTYMRKKYKIPFPDKVTVEESYIDWVNNTLEILSSVAFRPTEDIKALREQKRFVQVVDKLKMLQKELGQGNWIYTSSTDDESSITYKAIFVNKFGREMIWKHGVRFLLMSGTFVDPQAEVEWLGMEETA